MSESYWQEPYSELNIEQNEILSQSFSPLWSHTLEYVRVYLRTTAYPTSYKLSIQYLGPDGKPQGLDLSSITIVDEHRPYGAYTNTRQRKMPPIRLVKGMNYALLIEPFDFHPRNPPKTRYQPPPTTYPRGHLFRSIDGGDTWNTTSLGNLLFSEFGDPPLAPTPYTPPLDHWCIADYASNDYNTASCIRIGTSTPASVTLLLAVEKPQPIESYRTTRGVSTLCLDHYTFKVARHYHQLEKNESLYHTFHVTKLKEGQPYWFAFTADADFTSTPSTGPIFHKVHPESPPYETIKRPDAPGDLCSNRLTGNGLPCPDHYLTVNESVPDEEASQLIGLTINRWWYHDLYNIPDLEPFDRPIKKVHLTARFKRIGGYAYVQVCRIIIKTHGVQYTVTPTLSTPEFYKNFHVHLDTNPFTGEAWTRAEVNALQIGVGLRRTWSVGWTATGYCTQLYCKIYHDCSAYE